MMHALLRRMGENLDAARVRWMYLRLPERVEAPEGDIDLLIHPDDAASSFGVLRALGFVSLPAWGYGADRFFLAYDEPTETWIWLHIARDVRFGPYSTLPGPEIGGLLTHRVRYAGEWPGSQAAAWLPCENDAFWLLLLHCIFDKRRVKQTHRRTLARVAWSADAESTLARTFQVAAPQGWSAVKLLDAVREQRWVEVEACARAAVPVLPNARGSYRRTTATAAVMRLAGRARDAFRRGMTVSLMGPDGAGKSTLSRGIDRAFFFPTRSVYMGVGSGSLAVAARRLAAVQVGGKTVFARPPFTYGAYLCVLWFRYLTGFFHRCQGRLVVFDRYAYDAWLPMPGPISRLKAWALRIQARVVPAPDLVVVLDVPGETMFRRKGEFDPAHLERQRRHLIALRDRLENVEIVDGTRPADDVRRDVVERIWRRYRRRWSL